MNTRKEDALIESYRRALQIKMVNSAQEVRKLSGGNQQKVILARCMALNPQVLIVDEPTRGIDVGTKSEVHQVLFDMAKKGRGGDRDLLRSTGGHGGFRSDHHVE